MVSLPGKGVQQDMRRGFLHVLPVGRIPQACAGGRLAGAPEQRPHGLGDVVDEREQAGGLLRVGPDDEVRQREAVQKDIAAHGQLPRPHGQGAQPAAVVERAAPDDPQAVRQDGFFEEVPADGVEVFFGRSAKVEVIAAVPPGPFPAKGSGQDGAAVFPHRVAADCVRGGHVPGRFGEAVVPQFGDSPAAALRGRQRRRQGDAGGLPIGPDKAGRGIGQW